MKLNKFLVANGNPTLLVEGCSLPKRQEVITKYLGKGIDQIGFIKFGDSPKLEMMGNELCINATLAFASILKSKGKLNTSGIPKTIAYFNKPGLTTLLLPIKFSRPEENIILLSGIGFCMDKTKNKNRLEELCKKYNLPAFGKIKYYKNKIEPTIYVTKTTSTINESSCGSGSIAFSLFSRINKIVQPTGEIIEINRLGKLIKVSAKVTKIG